MHEIDQIINAVSDGERAVLATLVELQGSSFRRPGARMLILEDGTHVGTISGGCLEKDVARSAFALTENGPQKVLYDTRSDTFHPNGMYGTGCEGMVYLLLEPVPAEHLDPLIEIDAARSARRPIALAVIHEGPVLGVCGRATTSSVVFVKTIPNEVREVLSERVKIAVKDQTSHNVTFRFAESDWRVLIDLVPPRTRVVTFGTGSDARAVARLARGLEWETIVCGADPLKLVDIEGETKLVQSVSDLPEFDAFTSVAFLTHTFDYDKMLLPDVVASDAFYVGLLGPRRRTARLMTELIEEGTPIDVEKISAPAGLDLGSDEPASVALSIVSEMVAKMNGREGTMLGVANPDRIQRRVPTLEITVT